MGSFIKTFGLLKNYVDNLPTPDPVEYLPVIYVKKTGNDTTGDGTESLPYLTIAKGVSKLKPGMVLDIGVGTYNEQIYLTISGTETKRIEVRSSGGTVTLNGLYRPVAADPYSDTGQIYLGGSYITINGFTVINSPTYGIQDLRDRSSRYNIVKNCIVTDSFLSGFNLDGSYGEYSDNESAYNYDNVEYTPGRGLGGDADGFTTNGSYNKFIRCYSHHNSDDGFDLYGPLGYQPNPTVGGDYNKMIECKAYSNGVSTGCRNRTPGSGSFVGDGNGFKLGRGGSDFQGFNQAILCISYDNKLDGFTPNGAGGCQFIHCTAYNNINRAFRAWDEGGNAGEKTNIYINCLAVNVMASGPSGTKIETTNSWNVFGYGDINTNQFVSVDPTSRHFLKPIKTATFISSGTNVGYGLTLGARGAIEE